MPPIIPTILGIILISTGIGLLSPGSPRKQKALKVIISLLAAAAAAAGLVAAANLTGRRDGEAFAFLAPLVELLSRRGEEIFRFATAPPDGTRLVLAGAAAGIIGVLALLRRRTILDLVLSGTALAAGALAVTAWGRQDFPLYWLFVAIAAAAGIRPAIRANRRETGPSPAGRRAAAIGIGLAVLLAAILRFYRLDQHPLAFLDYEGTTGLSAVEVLEGNRDYHPFLWSFHARPIMNTYTVPLFIFPLAGLFRLFGVNLITLRSLAALFGVLTIPAIYLLVREGSSRLTALAAALVLAVSTWHITISRVGLALVITPLYTIIIGYWLLRAVRTRKWRYYIWAGLGLGGYWLFYMVGKITLLAAGALILQQMILRKDYLRRHWPGLAALLLAILLIACWSGLGPAAWLTGIGQQSNNYFWTREGPDSALAPKVNLHWCRRYLEENIRKSFRYLFIRSHTEFLLPSKLPLISPLLFPFFVLGFVLALAGWKRPLNFFLLALFFAAFLPRVLFAVFQDKASPRHLMLLIPSFAYFTALPFSLFGRWLGRTAKPGEKIAAVPLFLPLPAAAIVIFYITFATPHFEYKVCRMRRAAAEFIRDRLDDYYFYIVRVPGPLYLQNRIIDFITYPKVGALHYHLTDNYPPPGRPGAGETRGYRYIEQGELPGILDRLGSEIPRAGFVFEPLDRPELEGIFAERFGEGSIKIGALDCAPWTYCSFLYPPAAEAEPGNAD